MIVLLIFDAAVLAFLLGPPLGTLLLFSRRTRKVAFFLLLLPSTATGGGLFGFWVVQRFLYGRNNPQQEIEISFYVGWVAFYVLGLALALGVLLFRPHSRRDAFLKSTGTGIVASFITLACLAVIALVWREIESRYGAVGWDPVSGLRATPMWRVVPEMVIVFFVFFAWSARRLLATES